MSRLCSRWRTRAGERAGQTRGAKAAALDGDAHCGGLPDDEVSVFQPADEYEEMNRVARLSGRRCIVRVFSPARRGGEHILQSP